MISTMKMVYFLNADKCVVYYFIMRRFLDHVKNVPFSQLQGWMKINCSRGLLVVFWN